MKIYQYPSKAADSRINSIIRRGLRYTKKDLSEVKRIVQDVKDNGDKALLEYTRRFDAPNLKIESLKVTDRELREASQKVDRAFLRALNRADSQIEAFHRLQAPKSWINTQRAGTILGQLVNPVDAAGVYVPGGQGGMIPLVSSVLMGVIPARIAGVGKIVMVTPPQSDGKVNAHLLVAAQKAGVDAIYKVGGAWAIAALAFATETVPRVDVIVGPGNIYVTLAKKIVAGTVGIDMIAGPSEILVIADRTATPEFTAADLLSQAEHDEMASAILVTDSRQKAEAVGKAIEQQLPNLDRRDVARTAMDRYGAIIVVPDMEVAVELANKIAPEHLELHIKNPFEYIGRIRNAGAVFMGEYTPEPVGDYIAGPNHVLPTASTARFASALSVDHFVKKTSLIYYSKEAFSLEANDIIRLAQTENLGAHANAIKVRVKQG